MFLAKVSKASGDGVPGVMLMNLALGSSQYWRFLKKEVVTKEHRMAIAKAQTLHGNNSKEGNIWRKDFAWEGLDV